MSSDGTGQTNLTNMPGLNLTPAWSPDGVRILFTRYRSLTPEVYVMNSDGALPFNVSQHEATDGWASWSPDGGRIAFASNRHGDWEADPLWLPHAGHEHLRDEFRRRWSGTSDHQLEDGRRTPLVAPTASGFHSPGSSSKVLACTS